MKRNIYGITELNTKIKIGEYDDGYLPVGGRIFYIDSTSTATYSFIDSSGNEISSVAVGDTPYAYKKLTDGNDKEKYYVYHDELYGTRTYYWTYFDTSFVYEYLNFTSTSIGSGKTNTELISAYNNGAYITYSTSSKPTVWAKIQELRNSYLGNCSDWYLGSYDEIEQLRIFINENISTLGLTDYFTSKYIWSSSETSQYNARRCRNNSWDGDDKGINMAFIAIRSF